MGEDFIVRTFQDPESGYWIAESDDIPGLVTEAPSFDLLRRRVQEIAPELLELNRHLVKRPHSGEPKINFVMGVPPVTQVA